MNVRRKLAAPFQGKPEGAKQVANHQDKIEVVDGFVNFRNFTFPPLESVRQLKFNKYCGPTPESNWVIPGVLLVGAYPASEDDDDTFDLITSILKHGITKFVCLQSEYQAGVNREVWQAGGALRPYFEDVEAIVSQKDTIPELEGIKIVDSAHLSFDHCPIIDCGVTDDSKVLALAQKLTKDISEGEVIYLHCWGGHGRTGTVVCIMLYLLYGYTAKQAFDYCQAVHDLRTCPVEVGSPQTQTQRQQVVRVINSLIHEYEVRRARCEEEMRRNAQLQQQVEEEARQSEAAKKNREHNAAIEHANAHVPAPAAVPMKPNLVVRDTTQEHIFSMEKNNNSISVIGAGGSLAYNSKLGRKVHNNLQQQNGHAAQNGHASHQANGTNGKSTSFPAIQSKAAPSNGAKAPSPVNVSAHELTEPHHSSNALHRESPPTVSGNPSTSASPQKGLSENGALGLLQSLQAHPPRSPAPHNSRTEGLHKLHSRSALATPTSAGSELHPSEVYVPRSSDEGESTNDEDESGFLMVSATSGSRIPLHSHTSKGADRLLLQVPNSEDPSSPMEISPSVSSMNGSAHGNSFSLGYISSSTSCASRPMSVVQDSPFAQDPDDDLDLAATTSLTTEVMVMDLMTDPPGAVTRTSTSTTVVQEHTTINYTYSSPPTLDIDESNLDDMQSVRAPSSVDHPESRSQSTDSTPKQRRLSGKSISNAFKAGIKILTGGGSTPRGTKKDKEKHGELSNCSSNDSLGSGAAAVTPSHGSSKPSSLLIQSLKTASTESSSSFAHSPSHSNAPTPTHQQATSRLQGPGPAGSSSDALDKTTLLMGSVDPTPPKGQAPTARPQHGAILK